MVRLSVAQKADVLATFRSISVSLMETLAEWTPLTPELEVKLLFGRHLYEFAQHADVLGHRTAELRAGLHYTRPPRAEYDEVFKACRATQTGAERVASIYDALVPDLAARYDQAMADADPLLDQPTIRLVERIRRDLDRLLLERRDMLNGTALSPVPTTLTEDLRARFAAAREFVEFRPAKEMVS
jgi:hypothetical protein